VFEGSFTADGVGKFELVSGGDVTIEDVDRARDKTSLWQSTNTTGTVSLYANYGDEGPLLHYSLGYDVFDLYYTDSSHSVDDGEETIRITEGRQ